MFLDIFGKMLKKKWKEKVDGTWRWGAKQCHSNLLWQSLGIRKCLHNLLYNSDSTNAITSIHRERSSFFVCPPPHPHSMALTISLYWPHPLLIAIWLLFKAVCCPFPYLVDYHFDDKRPVNVKCEHRSVQRDRHTINVYQFITNMFLYCNFIKKSNQL